MTSVMGEANSKVRYLGDKQLGCACAYTMVRNRGRSKGSGAKTKARAKGVPSFADTYTGGTKASQQRFLCHQGFTGTWPPATTPLQRITPKRRLGFLLAFGGHLGAALGSLARFMCPKIQFGIGVNLFRLRD